MKRIRFLAAAAILAMPAAAVLPAAAHAQVADGVYIGGGAGVNFHQKADISGNQLNGDAEFDLGFALMGVVGYSFGGPRIEAEWSVRQNSTDNANVVNTGAGAINTTPDGEFTTLVGMLNVYYDISTGTIVTPYIGAGIGGGYAVYDDTGDDPVFAYQGIVGASFYLAENIDAFIDYRYFGTTDVAGKRLGRSADVENINHTIMAGFRYSFGDVFSAADPVAYAPPPAPAPPPPIARPAPVVAAQPAERAPAERRFLVFFDFDSAQVQGQGQQIIKDAAAASQVVAVTRIDVTGHADRAGGKAYNQRLSQRRARAVQRQLVQNGVPEKDIVIYARGEEDNLVPTRDGVREPQNRRVEIVLN